jgi:DNA invertase Pin-like site-specific DNA recombinase
VRCSSIGPSQKTDRQKINEKDFSLVIEDRISGGVPFFERPGGKKIVQLLNKGLLKELACVQLDRLGRDLRDVLNTIHYFTEKGICIHFTTQGLRTLDESGKQNPISNMIIGILSVVAQMERNLIKERQREGIILAVARGAFKGRKPGTKEDVLKFLSKEKNTKALEYLKKGLSNKEVAQLTGLNKNTISKIKKVGLKT